MEIVEGAVTTAKVHNIYVQNDIRVSVQDFTVREYHQGDLS